MSLYIQVCLLHFKMQSHWQRAASLLPVATNCILSLIPKNCCYHCIHLLRRGYRCCIFVMAEVYRNLSPARRMESTGQHNANWRWHRFSFVFVHL